MVERSDTFRICERKEAGTPAGVQEFMPRSRPVVSSLALLNHRLHAVMPPASSRSKSVINGREEYKIIAKQRVVLILYKPSLISAPAACIHWEMVWGVRAFLAFAP